MFYATITSPASCVSNAIAQAPWKTHGLFQLLEAICWSTVQFICCVWHLFAEKTKNLWRERTAQSKVEIEADKLQLSFSIKIEMRNLKGISSLPLFTQSQQSCGNGVVWFQTKQCFVGSGLSWVGIAHTALLTKCHCSLELEISRKSVFGC